LFTGECENRKIGAVKNLANPEAFIGQNPANQKHLFNQSEVSVKTPIPQTRHKHFGKLGNYRHGFSIV